jgi:hypothetical protein
MRHIDRILDYCLTHEIFSRYELVNLFGSFNYEQYDKLGWIKDHSYRGGLDRDGEKCSWRTVDSILYRWKKLGKIISLGNGNFTLSNWWREQTLTLKTDSS